MISFFLRGELLANKTIARNNYKECVPSKVRANRNKRSRESMKRSKAKAGNGRVKMGS